MRTPLRRNARFPLTLAGATDREIVQTLPLYPAVQRRETVRWLHSQENKEYTDVRKGTNTSKLREAHSSVQKSQSDGWSSELYTLCTQFLGNMTVDLVAQHACQISDVVTDCSKQSTQTCRRVAHQGSRMEKKSD